MRNTVRRPAPVTTLTRTLEALERELIEATDEEIQQAATDLKMNLEMRGSAAFLGLIYPPGQHWSDFFAKPDEG